MGTTSISRARLKAVSAAGYALLVHIKAIRVQTKAATAGLECGKSCWPEASMWARSGNASSCSSTASRRQGRGHRLAAVVHQPQAAFKVGLPQPCAIRSPLARGKAENSEHVTQLLDSDFEGKITHQFDGKGEKLSYNHHRLRSYLRRTSAVASKFFNRFL